LGAEPRFRVLPLWMMGVLGIFVPIMGELKEMAYQNDRDYFFNSDKFQKQFNYRPISAEAAVKELIRMIESKQSQRH
jgi:hypothetical protein